MANYHWYLKQSLHFGPTPQRAPVCICWDPERPLQLHVVTHDWTAITYEWACSTERSCGWDATDDANVAVVDGGEESGGGGVGAGAGEEDVAFHSCVSNTPRPDKILVTCFRRGVVPPPMCSFELQLSAPVNQATFLQQPQRTNQLAAVTADGNISVFGRGGC